MVANARWRRPPRGLVRDAAHLGGCVEGHVGPHEADEVDPRGEVLPAVLEHGSGQRVAAGFAPPAPASLKSGLASSALEGPGRPAIGAAGFGPVQFGGLGEGAKAALLSAAPLANRREEVAELILGQLVDERRIGVSLGHIGLPARPSARPIGNCRQTKKPGGRPGDFFVGEKMLSRSGAKRRDAVGQLSYHPLSRLSELEKMAGKAKRQPELDNMLDHLRKGDIVVVVKLGRIGRSTGHPIKLAETFE